MRILKKKQKTLWPLFMDGVQGGSLLFTIQFPEIPGTQKYKKKYIYKKKGKSS